MTLKFEVGSLLSRVNRVPDQLACTYADHVDAIYVLLQCLCPLVALFVSANYVGIVWPTMRTMKQSERTLERIPFSGPLASLSPPCLQGEGGRNLQIQGFPLSISFLIAAYQ